MHISFTHKTVQGFLLLDQMKVLDAKRFIRKVGYVGTSEFEVIIKTLKELL